MDKYNIDSHKMMHHANRVAEWKEGQLIYPIYMEISPSGSCNHRCIYCGKDFMEYQPRSLEISIFKDRLKEFGRLGVKSIMYAGEGEPFLHKDISDIIITTKNSGIDVAVTSNAVLFNERMSNEVLPHLTWIKVSIDAAKAHTYAKIHRTRAEDFNKVISNMAYAAKIRKKNRYVCTIGMQIILLPDNYREITLLAKKAKEIGMDYLVVKPYSQHPLSKTKIFKDIRYDRYLGLSEKLKKLNNKYFNVVFRMHTMKKWDGAERNYKHCLALPFWAYIDAGGDVWACSMYLTKQNFNIGNIYKNSFKEIWASKKHANLVHWAADGLKTDHCRVNCRMDEVNRYLWELKHPPEHVNFI